MTKAETGNPNESRMAKPEGMQGRWSLALGHSLVIGAWSLVIRVSDLIRHSGFAIRTSLIRVHPCPSVVPSLCRPAKNDLAACGVSACIRVYLRLNLLLRRKRSQLVSASVPPWFVFLQHIRVHLRASAVPSFFVPVASPSFSR
jgi:hypothetical protein